MIDGLVVIDKAPGWTSHDVVAKCRGIFGQRKVGHAGTLDPDATGVLLVGLGRMTRLLRFVGGHPKTYTGEIVLGVETSTLDSSGEVVATHDMAAVTGADVVAAAAAAGLVGDIEQIPPMVSAVKVGGRRLHELAREGKEVDRAPRPVTVHRFEIGEAAEPGRHPFRVECSAGTYVRTLVADLGHALGGGAHLHGLRREASGSFTVAGARTLEQVQADPEAAVLPLAEALRDLSAVTVDDEVADRVAHGARLPLDAFTAAGPPPWRVLGSGGDLLAVYEPKGDAAKPAVVVAGAG